METTEHELDISTHDLARRSTVPHDPETGLLIISTHDLTRRSTKSNASTILNGVNFNSRPHEEVDLWHRALGNQCNCFNSRPHEEVDDGWICDNSVFILVSTHDLTKRSTIMMKIPIITWTFQLTTSRRGRHV